MIKTHIGKLLCTVLMIQFTASGQTGSSATQSGDLNAKLMESTFRIEGHAASGAPVIGTGFLLGKPLPSDPKVGRYVLVTAAHVFSGMTGDSVNVVLRKRIAGNGWQETRVPVAVRQNGRPQWVQHPEADVAALYAQVPPELVPVLISTDLLATDKILTDVEIHPGDDLNCLGYPLGFQSPGGFPILRSGKIASYPLVPTKENPYFLLDFRVFKGNSGGPVYFVQQNRAYAGAVHVGTIQFIMGIVSEEISATEQIQGLYENRSETYPLSIAKIVPASFIVETLAMLPPPE